MDVGRHILLVVISAALIWAGGCRKSDATSATVEKLRIVATVYPLADVARAVGGRQVSVEWLVERGQRLDAVDPTSELRNLRLWLRSAKE